MKTLEILKDSLREAWDSMVLFIMLILIGVFLLIVSSIGFQPVTAEVALNAFSRDLTQQPLAMERGEQILLQRPSGYSTKIENIKSQDSNRPQFSAHEFDLIITNDVSTERIPNPNVKKDPTVDEPLFVEVTKEVPAIQKIVGLWHYDGKSDYIEIPENSSITLDNIVVKKPLTEEMYQAYFKWLIEKQLTAPVKELSVNTSNLPKSMQLSVKIDPFKAPLEWPVGFSIGFGLYETKESSFRLGEILFIIQNYVINWAGGFFIIGMGLVITSFFIPNTLRKGTIDLYLSKPINRTSFMLVKYLGGAFFVLILAGTLIGGNYVITGLRTGIWAHSTLWVIFLMTFAFMVLYAFSTLVAVLSRSAVACMLGVIALGGLCWGVGKVYTVGETVIAVEKLEAVANQQEEPKKPTWFNVTEKIMYVLPRWRDLDKLSELVIQDGLMTKSQLEKKELAERFIKTERPTWSGTLGVSAAWLAFFLGLACWRFSKKDY